MREFFQELLDMLEARTVPLLSYLHPDRGHLCRSFLGLSLLPCICLPPCIANAREFQSPFIEQVV